MTEQEEQAHAAAALDPVPESSPSLEAERIDPAKMVLLFNASKALVSTTDVDQLLNVIVNEVQTVLKCEGAGVLLFDEARNDFYWRTVRDQIGFFSSAQEEIRIPRDKGVCGWVFDRGEPALVHDAANDPRLYKAVDSISGFTTRNMVCVPLQGRERRLGVLYALNKVEGSFTDEDVEIMQALCGNVALALQNAAYYESLETSHQELDRLNRVKNKILNHLSHELKTPLAVIEASLKVMERRLEDDGIDAAALPFPRIRRNLGRLKTIEKQCSHIVEDQEEPERRVISGFLDRLGDLIEIEQEEQPQLKQALEALRQSIEAHFPRKEEQNEGISVEFAFQQEEFRVRRMLQDRRLDLEFVPPDPAIIRVQPQIMMSTLRGLVRNAVENTPDKGRIVVTGKHLPSGYRITVTDGGVGIPESEQPNIFEGFYPVQETDLYSSGRRYEFNAGGTGTDLLKIRIFAERFGFKVGFTSRRCSCIPTPRDQCPGDIAQCSCCHGVDECTENGGTEFVLDFPPDMVEVPGEGPKAEGTA